MLHPRCRDKRDLPAQSPLLLVLARRGNLRNFVSREWQSPKPGWALQLPSPVGADHAEIYSPRAAGSAPRTHTDLGIVSLSVLSVFSRWSNPRSFNSSAHEEGQVLPSQHARLFRDHYARRNSEGHLRSNKPGPVNMAREQWIEKAQYCVEQPRPQHRADESSQYNRSAREHGKHRAIEHPNKG